MGVVSRSRSVLLVIAHWCRRESKKSKHTRTVPAFGFKVKSKSSTLVCLEPQGKGFGRMISRFV